MSLKKYSFLVKRIPSLSYQFSSFRFRICGQVALLQVLFIYGITSGVLDAEVESQPRSGDGFWNKEILEVAKAIPIQEGGRVKPLDTYARFALLKLNGKRKCTTDSGVRISAIEWLLDCLFFPEKAKNYEVFLIENNTVVDAINVAHTGKKKRDRYSYQQLVPGSEKLFSLAREFSKIDEKKRDSTQAQLVHLAENLIEFEWLVHSLDFAREKFSDFDFQGVLNISGKKSVYRFSDVLQNANNLRRFYFSVTQKKTDSSSSEHPEIAALTRMLEQMDHVGKRSEALAIFPPNSLDQGATSWRTPTDIMRSVLSGEGHLEDYIELIHHCEKLADSAVGQQPGQFGKEFQIFQGRIKQLAEAKGVYEKIPLEIKFYQGNFFSKGLFFFIFAFVILSVSWLQPRSKVLHYSALGFVLCGTLALTIGIVFRCVIRSRPPVSTLYESILFITAVSVIVALIIEYFDRQKIALVLGTVLGAIGLFLANKYETKEGSDTMTSLVAVLDSNYWLSTHVTTVTIGYAAGLLASAIAHVYILGKFFTFKEGDAGFYRTLSKMVYGVIVFGLFFSIVGTILGGIWANDSWGRFWGWDPKENGALMIILWELTILHARLGGYIRGLGICVSAILVGCIVSFSWWGVNLLGIGLHSYGWTSGVFNSLAVFYSVEVVILALGAIVWSRKNADLPPQTQQFSMERKC